MLCVCVSGTYAFFTGKEGDFMAFNASQADSEASWCFSKTSCQKLYMLVGHTMYN